MNGFFMFLLSYTAIVPCLEVKKQNPFCSGQNLQDLGMNQLIPDRPVNPQAVVFYLEFVDVGI